MLFPITKRADVAQLVEHHLAKVRVASSNLVVRSCEKGASSEVPFGVSGQRRAAESSGGAESRTPGRLRRFRADGSRQA